MNTIVKALKGLYVKFGGSAADVKTVDTTAEMIDKVTTVASSGGGTPLPDMSGQGGKYLTNNGTAASWGEVSALPSMSEQSGKFLTNNGTTASWGSPTVDSSITDGGENPVTGGAIYTALGGKQATLTFDNSPTENSDNPVKSGGIYTALAGKASNVDVPLKLTGEIGVDADENTTLTITDDYTMQELYVAVNSGRLVYIDFELGEGMKLRAQSIGCYYIPANGGNEAQYSVTFNAITAEDEQGSVAVRFYSASFINSKTALVIVKTLTAS